jgi:hypothetical protein
MGSERVMSPVPLTALQRAVCWLRAVLRTGPLPVREVERLAHEVEISRRTLRRARAKLGVKSWPLGFGGRHAVALPEHANGDALAGAESEREPRDQAGDHAGVRRVVLRRLR